MHKSTKIWLTIFFMSAFSTYGQSKFETFYREEAETVIVKGQIIGQHQDYLYVIYKKKFYSCWISLFPNELLACRTIKK